MRIAVRISDCALPSRTRNVVRVSRLRDGPGWRKESAVPGQARSSAGRDHRARPNVTRAGRSVFDFQPLTFLECAL